MGGFCFMSWILRQWLKVRGEGLQVRVLTGVGRGAEDDDVEGGVGEHGLDGGVVLDVGVVERGRVGRGGRALEDGVQVERGGQGDERDVEDFGREADEGLAGGLITLTI
jgi:hypothetical protein